MSAAGRTCGECGRRLVDLLSGGEAIAPGTGICGACACMPGWFRDPAKRALLAPGHDGVEAVERLAPHPLAPCLAAATDRSD